MAKKSSIEKNNRRKRMAKKFAGRRAALEGDCDATRSCRWKSASPRRSSSPSCRAIPRPTAYRNRCELTGRPRRVYRKHRLSRIALRELGSKGLIPGLVKSSW